MSGGKQLSFPVFKTAIKEGGYPDETIIECALFLRSTDLMVTRKSWSAFANRFFEYYQPVILGYFGYQPEVLEVPKVKVTDKGLFMAVYDCYAEDRLVRLPGK